jgi:hypothetical protein
VGCLGQGAREPCRRFGRYLQDKRLRMDRGLVIEGVDWIDSVESMARVRMLISGGDIS